jgi:CarD family transcriptional regulator
VETFSASTPAEHFLLTLTAQILSLVLESTENQRGPMAFHIGEKVVYPNQGVGIVEQIANRNLTGQNEMFYLLRLTTTSMKVMVPLSSVESVGLRRVAKSSEVEDICSFLEKGRCQNCQDWKDRYKENQEKMRNGSLHYVAEVFKGLLILSQQKSLSFREKKMFDRAWQLLVDEIAVVRRQRRETIEANLVKSLSKSNLRVQLPS